MSGDAPRPPPAPDAATFAIGSDDLVTEFRAVEKDGLRRGLKLERFFWGMLKRIAESRKTTMGNLVEEIACASRGNGNLTSSIRVACATWLAEENAALGKLTCLKATNAILLACPSPAFALSSSRKILSYNPAFQGLVRRQLPIGRDMQGRLDLKLALDLGIPEIFSRLDASGGQPVITGFVIGAEDRRYRAQLNVVRAPLSDADVLLAYVFG